MSDIYTTRRLTPEEREELDRRWFGVREALNLKTLQAKRSQETERVTLVCPECGVAFRARSCDARYRLKRSRCKVLCCSRKCDHVRKRRQGAQTTVEIL